MTHVIFVIDLDGTMFDNSHRLHLLPTGEDKNDTAKWAEFNGACKDDTPRWPVIHMVNSLIAGGKDVRFLTGRGKSAHAATLTQLADVTGRSRTLISLTMRSMDDHRPAAEFKAEVISKWLKSNMHAEVVAIDDDPNIVEALRLIPRTTVLQIDTMCAAVKNENA